MRTFNSYVSCTLDWVSATIRYANIMKLSESTGHENITLAVKDWLGLRADPAIGKGAHSYKYGATYDDGIALYWGGTYQMGAHIQFQGKFIQGLSDPVELLVKLMSLDSKITRIDLAIDTTQVSCADDIYRAYERGDLKTRAQNVMRIQSLAGTTVYVGSRYSDRYLRVYDKGRQLNTGTVWTRIELEVKGLKAGLYAKVLLNEGLDAIPVLIRNFVDVPSVQWYFDAVRATNVRVGVPKVNKARDTQTWLLEIVIPCLLREMNNDPVFKARALRMIESEMQSEGLRDLIDIDTEDC